jgi:hypothetical protein
MQFRYLIVGIALAMLVFSVGLIATGTVKFKAFPDLEGNNLELTDLWQQNTPDLPDVVSIQYKESRVGPAGRAIHIPLSIDCPVRSDISTEGGCTSISQARVGKGAVFAD